MECGEGEPVADVWVPQWPIASVQELADPNAGRKRGIESVVHWACDKSKCQRATSDEEDKEKRERQARVLD